MVLYCSWVPLANNHASRGLPNIARASVYMRVNPMAGSALSNARGWVDSSHTPGRSEVEASALRLTHLLQPMESVRACRTAAASCTPVSYDAPSRCHAQSSTAFTTCRRPTPAPHPAPQPSPQCCQVCCSFVRRVLFGEPAVLPR